MKEEVYREIVKGRKKQSRSREKTSREGVEGGRGREREGGILTL